MDPFEWHHWMHLAHGLGFPMSKGFFLRDAGSFGFIRCLIQMTTLGSTAFNLTNTVQTSGMRMGLSLKGAGKTCATINWEWWLTKTGTSLKMYGGATFAQKKKAEGRLPPSAMLALRQQGV
eukprot:1322386-Amphidinium_carterae.1